MSASLPIAWCEIFAGAVRAIQAAHPQAHLALLNWGRWSRELYGIPGMTNVLTGPGIWRDVNTETWGDFADDADEGIGVIIQQREVKAEGNQEPQADAKQGEEIDVLIHDLIDPTPRRCLRVAYYWRIPEYQCPWRARVKPDDFLQLLDGALTKVQEAI